MTVLIKPDDQRVIQQALHTGTWQDSGEVITAALRLLAEDLQDAVVSTAREQEPRSTIDEVETELRGLGN